MTSLDALLVLVVASVIVAVVLVAVKLAPKSW
jgi:hypothetical protein